jgi:hypothetical protein
MYNMGSLRPGKTITLRIINRCLSFTGPHPPAFVCRSVIQTNPNHAPGWVAIARLEELAGNMGEARKLLQEVGGWCGDLGVGPRDRNRSSAG